MATFGERLKELRKEHNLTQKEVAEHLGVAANTVAIWERDEREPKGDDEYIRLAELFGVPLTYLFGTSDNPSWPESNDELGAEAALEDQKEDEAHMLKLYRELSPEMQRALRITLASMWKTDRDRGMLQQ